MRRPELQNRVANSHLLSFIFDELNREKSKTFVNNTYLTSLYEVIYQLVKECPKPLCLELFREMEEFLVDDVREKSEKESFSTHEKKLKAYIALFKKVLNTNKIRIRYSTQKKEIMEGIGPGMEVPMITDRNSSRMRQERAAQALQIESGSSTAQQQVISEEVLQDTKYDVNIRFIDQLEDFVDVIFDHLNSSSYSVRSLAGRGLAKIVSKLSPEMIKDVLESLLALVDEDEEESENLLHGVCLALGELSSVGLVLPAMLPSVIQILKRALLFETIKGNHASGNIVRDAGCYISWAFARGFDSKDLAPFVEELAKELLLVALFDNQGNCRRAAAAAFQENVGRQGNFPNGIEIISEMDFFSVGLTSNSFSKIAPFVASYPQYTRRFLDHLTFNRLCHISEEVRVLSGQSLGLISLFDPEYIVQTILPKLVQRSGSRILALRHGALVGIGNILCAFSGNIDRQRTDPTQKDSIFIKTLSINEKKLISTGEYMEAFAERFTEMKKQNIMSRIPPELIQQIVGALGNLSQKGMLKGIGGELTKLGLCFLAESLSIARVPLSLESVLEYMKFFENCVHVTIERVQAEAPQSLDVFSRVYMTDPSQKDFVDAAQIFLDRFSKEVILHVKVSYGNALSSFSKEVLTSMCGHLIPQLLQNAVPNRKVGNNDPEIRKIALRTLFKVIQKTGLTLLSKEQVSAIFSTLSKSIRDYTLDNRGDIGCIVREEAMSVYLDLLNLIANHKRELEKQTDPTQTGQLAALSAIMAQIDLTSVVRDILTQILQPNDRLRLRAGYVLQILTDQVLPRFPGFQGKALIDSLFQNQVLRLKFKEFQDSFFDKYDVALLDDKKFLAYNQNTNFVYFWNIPQCAYPFLTPLLRNEHFRPGILVGFLLSTCDTLEDKMIEHAMSALEEYLEEDSSHPLILAKASLKILSQHKKKEKFTNSVFSILKVIYQNHLPVFDSEFEAMALRLFRAIDIETKKTNSLKKLVHAGSLLTVLLTVFENLTREIYLEKVRALIPRFLFSEYPVVRKAFSEEFYMFLITKGDELFDSEMLEQVSQLLIDLDFTDILTEEHEGFQSMWEMMDHTDPL